MPRGSQGPAEGFARAVSSEVRVWIARRRLSIEELADQSGISRNYMYKRLRDDSPFNLNDIDAIATALGIDPFDLLGEAARQVEEPWAARRSKPERELEGDE